MYDSVGRSVAFARSFGGVLPVFRVVRNTYDIFSLVYLLGQVGYPKGDCQAGISAEYTSNGEDLLMGAVGLLQFRGKNLDTKIMHDRCMIV